MQNTGVMRLHFRAKNGADEVAFSCSEGYNKFKLRIYYRYRM